MIIMITWFKISSTGLNANTIKRLDDITFDPLMINCALVSCIEQPLKLNLKLKATKLCQT